MWWNQRGGQGLDREGLSKLKNCFANVDTNGRESISGSRSIPQSLVFFQSSLPWLLLSIWLLGALLSTQSGLHYFYGLIFNYSSGGSLHASHPSLLASPQTHQASSQCNWKCSPAAHHTNANMEARLAGKKVCFILDVGNGGGRREEGSSVKQGCSQAMA